MGYKLVLSLHGGDVKGIDNYQKEVLSFCLRFTDRVTTVSELLKEELLGKVEYDPERVTVVHNGFDASIWNSKAEVSRRKKHLVSVGSLRHVKGHDVLIRAFAEVKRKHPEASMTIIGEGGKRKEYESLIASLGLDDHVHLTGWLSQEKVKEELDTASVFVFPSRSEGFGIALLEAMASGLPIIASRVGGIPEVVAGTDALLVPPDDPAVLASVLSDKLSDKTWQKKSRRSSRQRAQEFSWEKATEKYKAVFNDLISK